MSETNDWLPIDAAEDAAGQTEADPASQPEPEKEPPAQPEAPEPEPAAPEQTEEETAAAMETARRIARAEAVLAGWEREAAAMREIYPAFDLKAEISGHGDFSRLLAAGIGVRRAYEAAHLEEILSAAMRYAALRAGQRAAAAIEAQRARPQENPVSNRAAVRTATDVNSLTRGDILRILGEVSRGARITFK